jgi:hypothetical protein
VERQSVEVRMSKCECRTARRKCECRTAPPGRVLRHHVGTIHESSQARCYVLPPDEQLCVERQSPDWQFSLDIRISCDLSPVACYHFQRRSPDLQHRLPAGAESWKLPPTANLLICIPDQRF